MSSCAQNERKFGAWEEMPGKLGWRARYFKEVDPSETTLRFWQEIFDCEGNRVEVHEKYPVDKGHRKG